MTTVASNVRVQVPAVGAETQGLEYMTGFGNEFATEAVEGALPVGRNSPQRPPLGLYCEQFNATSFTAPRGTNKRTWTYRIRPSAIHPEYRQIQPPEFFESSRFDKVPTPPNRLRWNPQPAPATPADFIDGIFTMCGNGDLHSSTGSAIHTYHATKDMGSRVFVNNDGEMLIIPELGGLRLRTELGVVTVSPLEIAVVPRGIRFSVDLLDGQARGYISENYGAHYKLPDLGPVGANGLASPRDFLTPVAAYGDVDAPTEVVQKFGGNFWQADYPHSPLDVVAWHGNIAPYKYDLMRFMIMGSTRFDHPDPSLYTVLTSPSEAPGQANADFIIFPPRWLVMEDTFRPPWFHRNVTSEFMGLVQGAYNGKAEGFVPGGATLHNSMSAHGPDKETFDNATNAVLEPNRLESTMAFMLETRWAMTTTPQSAQAEHLQSGYDGVWADLERRSDIGLRD